MKEKIFFSSRVLKIIMFIDGNFARDISLQQICLAANLSEPHGERTFKQEVGVQLKKFVILKRLYEAVRILKSDVRVSEGDLLSYCGFNDLSNFIRQFKKHFGCAPIKFRNCYRDLRSCGLWK